MKYIMYEKKVGDLVRKIPIIFPNELVHLDVAKALSKIVGTSRIVGAGDICFDINSIGGESTTIGIKSKKDDKEVIQHFDYIHGIKDNDVLNKMLSKEVLEKIFGKKGDNSGNTIT